MDINEFSFVVNVCGGKDKIFIKEYLEKRNKRLFNKKLKYSFENLVNELARQENMENFDWSKIEFEDY